MQKILLRVDTLDAQNMGWNNPLVKADVLTVFPEEFDLEDIDDRVLVCTFAIFCKSILADEKYLNLERYKVEVIGKNFWIRLKELINE